MAGEAQFPEPLERLVAALARLPGIGKRSAGRLALALLDWPEEALVELGQRLGRLKQEITACPQCGNLAAGDRCRVCANPKRDSRLLCVVETALQIPPIEAAGCFHGLYHVLGGRIQPLDGKGPADLRIRELQQRLADNQVDELILATGSDVEGEATANYLAQQFASLTNLRISRLAAGLPVGADLSYADPATIAMAISRRRPA